MILAQPIPQNELNSLFAFLVILAAILATCIWAIVEYFFSNHKEIKKAEELEKDIDHLKRSDVSEYILCAAIHLQDGKKYSYQPLNIKEGLVVSGRRHHNCFTTVTYLRDYGKSDPLIIPTDQGFLTSKNRFVTREEAADIAFKRGQIKKAQPI